VIRTKESGIEFSAITPWRGYKVSFAMQRFTGGGNPSLAGLDLMLACVKDDQSYNLLLPRIFAGTIPDHFVYKYVY
jgi:hypothetical protein